MGAVVEGMKVGQAALKAIIAGHDIVLICKKSKHIEIAHTTVSKAIARAEGVAAARFAESRARILKFLATLS
jgi:hypothetical protein